jgi:D-citramalate synthase
MKTRTHSPIEVLDTTLRDGEQTPGVAFTPAEKLEIARMLLTHLHVDRLEIASARVSVGEDAAVRSIIGWARKRECAGQLEILGFVDGGRSVEWIRGVGGEVLNLLAKGSEHHCRVQLRKTPARHLDDLCREIERAHKADLRVNLYLEDWSNGMRDNFAYVYNMVDKLRQLPVERFMLADTLGVLTPDEVARYMEWMLSAFPDLHFDFHGHNDYGMATANALAAVNAGAQGLHATINGLGERAGNLTLAQLTVAINDLSEHRVRIAEKELQHASDMVQTISGKRCAWNMPVLGSDVYTQTCGVHADGDKKGDLYANALAPERFGRRRDYALGKLAGRASIDQNIDQLGLDRELDPELRRKVLDEVIRLGDKKKHITSADLPFIIAGVLRAPVHQRIRIVDFEVKSHFHASPKAKVVLEVDGRRIETAAAGDGGYDAFVKALKKGLKEFGLSMLKLLDYEVRIPPGGRTDALVEASITWSLGGGRTMTTTGVDSDQLVAAVMATEKILNHVAVPAPDAADTRD